MKRKKCNCKFIKGVGQAHTMKCVFGHLPNYKEVMNRRSNAKNVRNEKIVAEYLKGGVTMRELGEKYEISRQRVHQLLEQSSRWTQGGPVA